MINNIVIAVIKTYQYILSPLIGNQCRFHPTCSCYAIQAFQQYHFFKAFYLTVKRLWRCQPFYQGGIDPIPTHPSEVIK